MNYYILIYLYILISTLLSFVLFLIYNKLAKKINYIDNKIPTGSGIVFYIIFFLGFFYFYYFKIFYLLPNKFEIIFLSIILFAILSFADDKINIHFAYRFISQLLLIFLSLSVIPINELQLPLKIAMLISLICWIIILNYINLHQIFLIPSQL
jgi:UDP-N-acetylmuramyl pentapeptide phosphotransferase/UDP-N-acetylglucosamine-1-phosphate transferase